MISRSWGTLWRIVIRWWGIFRSHRPQRFDLFLHCGCQALGLCFCVAWWSTCRGDDWCGVTHDAAGSWLSQSSPQIVSMYQSSSVFKKNEVLHTIIYSISKRLQLQHKICISSINTCLQPLLEFPFLSFQKEEMTIETNTYKLVLRCVKQILLTSYTFCLKKKTKKKN